MNQVNIKKYKKSGVDWIGKVPLDWELIKIAGIFDFRNTKASDKDFEPLSVTYEGVKKQLENVAKTDNNENRKLVKIGDIVINGRSDRKGAVGVSEYNGSVSNVYHVLKRKHDKIEVKYFHYLFRNPLFSQEFFKWGKGIHDDLWTTRSAEMGHIIIPQPPFETQKRIADFLDEKTKIIDELIEKKEKLIELLREKRASLITRAVTKGLDPKAKMKPSGVDWLGDIPEGWALYRIRFLVKTNPSKSEVSSLSNQMVSFLPMSNVSEYGRLDLSDERELNFVYNGYTYFRDGDVILAKITPCFENGKGAFVYGLTNKIGFGSTEFHVFRPKKIQGKFLYYFFKCDAFKKFGELNMKGTAGQKRVPELFIKDFIICLPHDHEQKRISNFLDAETAKIDKAVELIESQIEKLKEYRSSLIYHAVTGKIEV